MNRPKITFERAADEDNNGLYEIKMICENMSSEEITRLDHLMCGSKLDNLLAELFDLDMFFGDIIYDYTIINKKKSPKRIYTIKEEK